MCVVWYICVFKRNWFVVLFGICGCILFILWCSFFLVVLFVLIFWFVNDLLLVFFVSMIYLCYFFYFFFNLGWYVYFLLKIRFFDGVLNFGLCFFFVFLKLCGYDCCYCRWLLKKNVKMSLVRFKNWELDRESVMMLKIFIFWLYRCEEYCILIFVGSDLE